MLTNRRAGLTALATVVAVVTAFLAVAGGLLTPSSANAVRLHQATATVTRTIRATATVTVKVPGPTATVTVPGPTATVTVPGPTATVTVPGPTVTATPIATATATATATTTTTPAPAPAKKIFGYFAPAATWSSRVSTVGANGLKARRIYGQLTTTGNSMSSQITAAISAGMMPMVSYKLGGVSVDAAATGSADAAAKATAAYLDSLGVPIAVSVFHEPEDDMTGPQFVAMQKRLIPFFQRGKLSVGPILHGFELDNATNTARFKTYLDPTLTSNTYDFVGIDSYQTGTAASPGSIDPGDRIAPLEQVLSAYGVPNMPIGVGEYNGWQAQAISDAGKTFLSTPNLWFACMWDADGNVGSTLVGDRVTAFQASKADSRAQQ
jgi:hypothetical protein